MSAESSKCLSKLPLSRLPFFALRQLGTVGRNEIKSRIGQADSIMRNTHLPCGDFNWAPMPQELAKAGKVMRKFWRSFGEETGKELLTEIREEIAQGDEEFMKSLKGKPEFTNLSRFKVCWQ